MDGGSITKKRGRPNMGQTELDLVEAKGMLQHGLECELEGLVDMFSVQCINHNVETVLDLSDDMPKVVRGDSGKVVQVFANLTNNSIKFTTCINPSKWDFVFESFEQADSSTTRLHGGTGLGLCIVRNLVNKMGGEIKVTKKEGQGTLMRL
ncbi:hypothetical protein RYX36_001846 [Vicia faba]